MISKTKDNNIIIDMQLTELYDILVTKLKAVQLGTIQHQHLVPTITILTPRYMKIVIIMKIMIYLGLTV